MNVHCRKYKTSRKHIQQVERSYLASFLEKQLPGAQFRFITFEKDDYQKSGLTFLLCNVVPEKILISVESAPDLEPAICEIIQLNPSVSWDKVDFIYPTEKNDSTGSGSVELRFTELSMVVDNTGLRSICPH